MKLHYVVALFILHAWSNVITAGLLDRFKRNRDSIDPTSRPVQIIDPQILQRTDPIFTSIKGYVVQTNCNNNQDAMRNCITAVRAYNNEKIDSDFLDRTFDMMLILHEFRNAPVIDDSQKAIEKKLISMVATYIPKAIRQIVASQEPDDIPTADDDSHT